MKNDDENVTKLPVRFKEPMPEHRTLVVPHEVGKSACSHFDVQYIVNSSLAEVECGVCKEKLNPMWVLSQLANRDRRMYDAHQRYNDEMKRLNERSATKCDHCGRMTRISRR